MEAYPSKILLVDEEAELLKNLSGRIRGAGHDVAVARSAAEAAGILDGQGVDVVVVDRWVWDADGEHILRQLRSRWPEVEIILTGHGAGPTPEEMAGMGVFDYLAKPVPPERLLLELRKASGAARLERENRHLRRDATGSKGSHRLVGAHPRMKEILEIIERIGQNPSTVLIEGESGTGKELVARAIHAGSPRPEAPFIPVNCGAFSRTLLESQLFGHRRGAFTGAVRDQDGVFVSAEDGTLFLDEITEMDLDLQGKLLRVLQEKEVTRLGENLPTPVRARIVVATNRPIREMVLGGAFREDLYYRINVVNIRIPPLRERREDIPPLVDAFLEEFSQAYGVRRSRLSDDAREILLRYSWPGNVRELRNVIERSYAMGPDTGVIGVDDLPEEIRGAPDGDGSFLTLREMERAHIVQAMRISAGIRRRAAALLGIHRNRLSRLLAAHGLEGSRRVRT